MAALPFLEQITLTGLPAGTTYSNTAGQLTATTTRIYTLTRRGRFTACQLLTRPGLTKPPRASPLPRHRAPITGA